MPKRNLNAEPSTYQATRQVPGKSVTRTSAHEILGSESKLSPQFSQMMVYVEVGVADALSFLTPAPSLSGEQIHVPVTGHNGVLGTHFLEILIA
jgi:hypothetical protein